MNKKCESCKYSDVFCDGSELCIYLYPNKKIEDIDVAKCTFYNNICLSPKNCLEELEEAEHGNEKEQSDE